MPEILFAFITILTFVYFITLNFLENGLNKIKKPSQIKNEQVKVKVTVIVSARNEEKNLPALIDCLSAQNHENIDLEFILVNDRSEDLSGKIISEQSKIDSRFKALHITKRVEGFAPKKYAIDSAINIATGDIILLTDADGQPGKNWVKSMITYFANGADMLLGYAPYNVKNSDSITKKILALEYFSHASIAAATTGLGFPLTCVGTNMAYRKKVYQQIGGFGEYKSFISGDDDLFLTRVREAGNYKICYATDPRTHVYNAPPNSFKQFVHQRLRYASKGFDYPAKVTFGLIIYIFFNLSIFFGLFCGLAGSALVLQTTLLAIAIKTIFEYKFTRKAAAVIGDRRFTNYYFITSVLHIPYILFFGILGQFKLFRWAEKSTEHGIVK
jgi:cellulose synthase/poly-beta-1,6-N-acetylglucosamine synthase-like glycosyltransferase